MKKTILFYIERWYPIKGGAESSALRLAKALVKKGYKIKVLTGQWNKTDKLLESKWGIQIRRIPMAYQTVEKMRVLNFFVNSMLALKFEKYDILHMHGIGLFSGLLARAVKPKMSIIKTTTEDDVKNVAKYPMIGKMCLKALNNIDHFICTSKAQAKEVRKHLPKVNIVMIPNGIDTEKFKRRKNGKRK
jgi:glycosyltransferase involved in cell wall biosynthesis